MRLVVREPGPAISQRSISLLAERLNVVLKRRPFCAKAFFVTALTTPPVEGAIQGGGALKTSMVSMLLIVDWLNSKARLEASELPVLERGGVPAAAGIWPSKVKTVDSGS